MSRIVQLVGCLVSLLVIGGFFAAVAGYYFYTRSNAEETQRAQAQAACGADAACTSAVTARFDICFKQAWIFNQGVIQNVFALCINETSPTPVFPPSSAPPSSSVVLPSSGAMPTGK